MRRRHFLAALAGAAACPAPLWAEAGAPDYLSAANRGTETFLLGLRGDGTVVFALPIPARGHAAAAHPFRAEAVAFARRPGTFASVIDCARGIETARLESPAGRHFYGHGAFTADGAWLLTTENDYDTPDGRIGVWDVAAGYARVADLPSGGIGPHEIIRLPSGGFAVANGGIQTHPSNDRARLNLPEMRSSLAWLSAGGTLTAHTEAPAEMRQNSIRHIACDGAGRVVAALQWQGNPLQRVPLMAVIAGDTITYHDHPETGGLKQYGGSVAITRDSRRIAVTGPKGGHVLFFDGDGTAAGSLTLSLASGAAPEGAHGLVLTHAGGLWHGPGAVSAVSGGWVFDNHLVAIQAQARSITRQHHSPRSSRPARVNPCAS